MSTTPKHPFTDPPTQGPEPYSEFDAIPAPDVVEKSSDTTWQLWDDVRDRERARYADTAPMTAPGSPSLLDKADPAHPVAPLRPAVATSASGPEKLLEECRRNNRVCPLPAQWQEFDALLRARVQHDPRSSPVAPLSPRDWQGTTALAKRSIFRTVVDWAIDNTLTGEALRYLRALPEEHWHHIGD